VKIRQPIEKFSKQLATNVLTQTGYFDPVRTVFP
jgi:hypothetical protein